MLMQMSPYGAQAASSWNNLFRFDILSLFLCANSDTNIVLLVIQMSTSWGSCMVWYILPWGGFKDMVGYLRFDSRVQVGSQQNDCFATVSVLRNMQSVLLRPLYFNRY